MVGNYRNADCSLRGNYRVIYYNSRNTFVPYWLIRGEWVGKATTYVKFPAISHVTSFGLFQLMYFRYNSAKCEANSFILPLLRSIISSTFTN